MADFEFGWLWRFKKLENKLSILLDVETCDDEEDVFVVE
jgi:hypothetical protein